MSSLRPVILGLGMAVLAAFGTDYLLQRRARAEAKQGNAAAQAQAAPAAAADASKAVRDAEPVPKDSPATPQLAVGQRAISLQLPEGIAENLIRPGSLVDVLATLDFQANGGSRHTTTRVIAERVTVLAVQGREADRTSRRGNVSLAVSADAANAIELASAKGTIGFALRDPRDETVGGTSAASLHGLAGEKPAEQPTPEAAGQSSPKWEIQVIRGSQSARESIDSK